MNNNIESTGKDFSVAVKTPKRPIITDYMKGIHIEPEESKRYMDDLSRYHKRFGTSYSGHLEPVNYTNKK